MNLAQMQMEYRDGKLQPAKPAIKFANLNPPRHRQAQNRAKGGNYTPFGLRPKHDSDWK